MILTAGYAELLVSLHRQGRVRCDVARSGPVWQAWHDEVRPVMAGNGKVRQAWRGQARLGGIGSDVVW